MDHEAGTSETVDQGPTVTVTTTTAQRNDEHGAVEQDRKHRKKEAENTELLDNEEDPEDPRL